MTETAGRSSLPGRASAGGPRGLNHLGGGLVGIELRLFSGNENPGTVRLISPSAARGSLSIASASPIATASRSVRSQVHSPPLTIGSAPPATGRADILRPTTGLPPACSSPRCNARHRLRRWGQSSASHAPVVRLPALGKRLSLKSTHAEKPPWLFVSNPSQLDDRDLPASTRFPHCATDESQAGGLSSVATSDSDGPAQPLSRRPGILSAPVEESHLCQLKIPPPHAGIVVRWGSDLARSTTEAGGRLTVHVQRFAGTSSWS